MATKKAPPNDVDHYIAGFPSDVQRQLRKIRSVVRRTVPGARETISYGMPAFLLNGVGLLSFAAWKSHIALYPAPTGSARFNRQLLPYRGAKSTVRLPLDEPMPVDLIEQIVKLRVKDAQKRARERELAKSKLAPK